MSTHDGRFAQNSEVVKVTIKNKSPSELLASLLTSIPALWYLVNRYP